MASIRIPATSANLGVLFDKGAVALDVFENTIYVEKAVETKLHIQGEGRDILPYGKENLVYRAIEHFYRETGRRMPGLSLGMQNGIPLSKGLGSSAACIAGGIFAANELEGKILNLNEMIMMAAGMEGHGDNVCAALAGGIVLFEGNGFERIPEHGAAGFILFIPESTLSTKKSREVLPSEYDEQTLATARRLEHEMIRALRECDYEKAGALMQEDVLHQPYRKSLIPYWDDVISASAAAGSWGTSLSGAGPAMISICPREAVDGIAGRIKMSIDKKYGLNIIGCGVNGRGISHV
ncbi:MAG: homoserine kinase, partial [Clostridia bacterium]